MASVRAWQVSPTCVRADGITSVPCASHEDHGNGMSVSDSSDPRWKDYAAKEQRTARFFLLAVTGMLTTVMLINSLFVMKDYFSLRNVCCGMYSLPSVSTFWIIATTSRPFKCNENFN
mgnify:CR=1 FL=1